jgi:hypothetical protein
MSPVKQILETLLLVFQFEQNTVLSLIYHPFQPLFRKEGIKEIVNVVVAL